MVLATGFTMCLAVNFVVTQVASAADPTTMIAALPVPRASEEASDDESWLDDRVD